MRKILFRDRREAGRRLALQLAIYADAADVIVLALPRGGVLVAAEVAAVLKAALDVFIVRKLGVPWQPELAMGAITASGAEVLNGSVITAYNIPPHVIREVAEQEMREVRRRSDDYRGKRPLPNLQDRLVILVDDGLATGSTMRAAVTAIKPERPRRIVVAAPVGATDTCEALRRLVDEVICVHEADDFSAVGEWYQEFSQVTDAEVRDILRHEIAAC